MNTIEYQTLAVVLAPLIGAALSGLFCRWISRRAAHCLTILGVTVALAVSCLLAKTFLLEGHSAYQWNWYTWLNTGHAGIQVGFLLDTLSVLMLGVVTSVSLLVHVYTIGYMHDDPGYQRFFSYISLFTFAMLVLVLSNNFMQLFFGWEAVGLVSYLLIGFWFKKETAIFANMKAFLVNRVGDFGFIIGIAAIFSVFGTLEYTEVFNQASVVALSGQKMVFLGTERSVITFIAIALFIGAMGKSAQVPLHVWLPDSMEGPTPISALIHAATMVTAGVFMVCRMSPIFEHSETALSFVMIIGATTCFFMGLLGLVQNDIKRVVAYSTLSQLGYMVVALGASAYSAAMYHLMTHAFFKALLFLGAGSVIIAMHHEQDIRKMGNLRPYLPITYVTMLLGSLALIGFPFFSGFYSKDLIIESVRHSTVWGSSYASFCVTASVFVTALYSFRMFFLVFHTKPKMDADTQSHLHEPPAVVWLPLVCLAIPSVILGYVTLGTFTEATLAQSIFVLPEHNVVEAVHAHFHDPIETGLHFPYSLPFWLAFAGVCAAWIGYVLCPTLTERIKQANTCLYSILINKYGFDHFNQAVLATGTRWLAMFCWRVGDRTCIDGVMVNGSAKTIKLSANLMRGIQSGYLVHYAMAMVTALIVMSIWLIFKR